MKTGRLGGWGGWVSEVRLGTYVVGGGEHGGAEVGGTEGPKEVAGVGHLVCVRGSG